jgi:hypothetical protein
MKVFTPPAQRIAVAIDTIGKSDRFKPPAGVANAARRGLELRRKNRGRGGTGVGVARARTLSNQQEVGLDTIKKMYSFFARHAVDKKGEDWDNVAKPSKGRIAWLLWGGDAGETWARSIRERAIKSGAW